MEIIEHRAMIKFLFLEGVKIVRSVSSIHVKDVEKVHQYEFFRKLWAQWVPHSQTMKHKRERLPWKTFRVFENEQKEFYASFY